MGQGTRILGKTGALALAIAAFAIVGAPTAQALQIWGNNAAGGGNRVESFDETNGTLINQFAANPSGNGRGVVTIGNVLYYTLVGDGVIHELDATTGAPLAANLHTGQSSLATIAYDPFNSATEGSGQGGFWLGDYSGTNHAYFFDLKTGSVTHTITLGNCGSFCDGLEFYVDGSGNHRLISNRGDALVANHYDVYDTSGALITAALITGEAGKRQTGIAFDGTDFFVSDIVDNMLSEYDANGVFIKDITLGGPQPPGGRLLEDLSFDYNIVIPPSVPEPGTLSLLGSAMLGFAWVRRRRAAK